MIHTPSGFKVFGHFSEIEDDHGTTHVVRSVLEIMTTDTALDSLPDAVFVMMNPGSCEKIDDSKQTADLPPTCNCVARPDNTQKRIIDLMTHLNWGHARILNLSDLRNARSPEFYNLLPPFKDPIHSIFHGDRKAELQAYLKAKNNAPLIKAWGVNPKLKDLAKTALKVLPNSDFGLPHREKVFGYYHPLPRDPNLREWWLSEMLKQLSQ